MLAEASEVVIIFSRHNRDWCHDVVVINMVSLTVHASSCNMSKVS